MHIKEISSTNKKKLKKLKHTSGFTDCILRRNFMKKEKKFQSIKYFQKYDKIINNSFFVLKMVMKALNLKVLNCLSGFLLANQNNQ